MEYLQYKRFRNGGVISKMCGELFTRNPSLCTMLFLRTPHTGGWMDSIALPPHVARTMIIYSVNTPGPKHREDVVLCEDKDVANYLQDMGKTFDVICIDPFHEFAQSTRDLALCVSLLNDNGVLLCHDCRPENHVAADPVYRPGGWSGTTYAAFVRTARDHPLLYYTILNIDTGIGIICKDNRSPVCGFLHIMSQGSSLDRDRQDEFLALVDRSDYNAAFAFFATHGHAMINLIDSHNQGCQNPSDNNSLGSSCSRGSVGGHGVDDRIG